MGRVSYISRMIKATEVRKGNLVELRLNKLSEYSSWEIKALSIVDIYELFDTTDETKDAKPIPLTPEIWKTVSDEEGILELHTDDHGVVIRTDLSGNINLVYDWGCKIIEVKYVHKLQNLYYIIAGKELPIALPVEK